MIGSLRHRLTIEAPAAQDDGYGGKAEPWAAPAKVARVWGRIEPLSGGEQLQGLQLTEKVTHRITIRYRDDVAASQRVRLGTRVFNIRAVIDPEQRGRWLELLCEEGVAT